MFRGVSANGTWHLFAVDDAQQGTGIISGWSLRLAGARRVGFASSGAPVSAIQKEEPYRALTEGRYSDVDESWPMLTERSMPRPAGLYGVSKVWGEVLARHFVDTSPLSILCLRIGYVNAEASAGGFDIDDDGYLLGVGLRGRPADQFELEGAVNYTDLSDSGDTTSFGLGARWYFTEQFALVVEGEFGDDANTYGVGVRWNFGQ